MRRWLLVATAGLLIAAMPGITSGNELDHPGPAFTQEAQVGNAFNSGGENADWELITTVATGNPHTDLDFFTQDGETYASVGTLGTGPNGAGQTIIRLTKDGKVNEQSVEFVAGHPSAECPSNPRNTLGLQHDVEATPKGNVLFNTRGAREVADKSDAQLLLDATDSRGRCHDNGETFGVVAPQGGIEIIDITDVHNPKEIGLTSHIGEAHTVNVDPKRPHIAYAVTSDAVTVSKDTDDNDKDGNTEELVRENEIEDDNDASDLDGFEVINLKSCMNFPEGTSIEDKREQCRPQVWRFRYPTLRMALGHSRQTGTQGVFGCHELEVYPNDLLSCGGGNAAILFDLKSVFNDMGTPNNYRDDKVRGTPMPCRVRDSSSDPVFQTGAKITDCVQGEAKEDGTFTDLRIPSWLKLGKPGRLRGVEHLGSAHHQGRGATDETGVTSRFDATEDIDFNHETELTDSGNFLIASDERGGGVVPPGASCSSAADNKEGNGGLHAYAVDRLQKRYPSSPKEAFKAYARQPNGEKAIHRVPIHTGVEPTVCTAHVFQQIPGQNRIFMGWYSQGTQVIDFVENADGTFKFKQAGYFIPEMANEWVSHIFKVRENRNGLFTYWGVAGDFKITEGRNVIDVYKVTLPRPPSLNSACRERRAITGDSSDNALVGTPKADIICGLGGDDQIRGRGGEDLIIGGSGDDGISGGGAKDQISGDAGNDSVSGGGQNDSITGDDGRDILKGNKGIDTLRGGEQSDVLQGGFGDDSLFGNDGDDRLRGYSGDDFLDGGRGQDTCSPGKGDDRTRNCE